ncbi:MAG: pyridoxal-phosphate dependent enzyme, partial [Pseudomonadota bacterium]
MAGVVEPVDRSMPGLEDVRDAATRIAGHALRTPLIPSELAAELGQPVLLKLETLQPSGSFKLRGALNAVSRLAPEVRVVACASTGNHGRALAWAARATGRRAIVCLSALVPEVKVRAVHALGAEVHRIGRSQDDAQEEVDRLVASGGAVEIPPFDHPDVITGQGTIALEILEEQPAVETLLVPLSGGGLIAGMALAAKALKPSIRVIGLSMERGAAMASSLAAGRPVQVEEAPS